MGSLTPDDLALVFVDLPDEATPTIRPTNAEVLGGNLYRLLPTKRYDPENEEWEFLPGTIVVGEMRMTGEGVRAMIAVKAADAADIEANLGKEPTVGQDLAVLHITAELRWLGCPITSMTRLANAVPLGGKLYRLLPKEIDDRPNDVWEYPPGSIVHCEWIESDDGVWLLLPVRLVRKPEPFWWKALRRLASAFRTAIRR